jgi:uncharacterized membrane protein YkoI
VNFGCVADPLFPGGDPQIGTKSAESLKRNMKTTQLLTTLLAASLPLIAVLAEDTAKPGRIEKAAPAYAGEELAKDAKLTLLEARAIALKTVPGKVTYEELEKEEGGSGLRYSFDIKNGSVTHEVGVDAKTGKLLENNDEGSHGRSFHSQSNVLSFKKLG